MRIAGAPAGRAGVCGLEHASPGAHAGRSPALPVTNAGAAGEKRA
jgi:hypothetical protein